MTLKLVIILQNLIKAYHRKSGKSKYDRKLDVQTDPVPCERGLIIACHGIIADLTQIVTTICVLP